MGTDGPKMCIRSIVLPSVLMILLAAVLTWPMAVSGGAYDYADTLFNSWLISWNCHSLLSFQNPLAPPVFVGQPDAHGRNDLLLTQAAAGMPGYALGMDSIRIHNLLFVLSLALAGLASYLLARRLRIPEAGSWFAGAAVVALPFFQSHLWHLQLMSVGLSILALERAIAFLEGDARGWAVGLLVLLQGAASLYYWMFLNIALVILFLHQVVRGRYGSSKTLLAWTLAGDVLMLPLLLSHLRNAAGFPVDTIASTDVAAFVSPWFNSLLLSWARPESVVGEVALWPGIAVAGGALLWLWRRGQQPELPRVGFLAAMGLFFAVFSLGPTLVVFGTQLSPAPFRALAWIPGLSSIRLPARAGIFALIPMVLFSAAFIGRRRLLAAAGILLCLLEVYPGPHRLTKPAVGPWHAWIAEVRPALVVYLPIVPDLGEPETECVRLYGQTTHFVPAVNGYSTSLPAGYEETARVLNSWPSGAAEDLMDSLGVECVLCQGSIPEDPDTVWHVGPRRAAGVLRGAAAD